MSINYDDLVKEQIVKPSILEVINGICEWQPSVQSTNSHVYHAGLLHTYGYLFSQLKTSFGYKRDRWISKNVACALGLPGNIWGPYPYNSHFFINVSFLAASIAFRTEEWMPKDLKGVALPLQAFDFLRLPSTRIQETICFPNGFDLFLRTDLIKFEIPSESGETFLLIYSIRDSRDKQSFLITLFPVSTETAQKLLSQEISEVENIKIQYNAYFQEASSAVYQGIREIIYF
jgi:hypothetical protein